MTSQHMAPGQALEVAGAYHFWIMSVFILGYLIHAGLQVDAIARSKNNPINTRWCVIEQNIFRLAGRFFISFLLFIFMWKNPSTVPTVLGYFGLSLSANAVAILTLPMSPPVSGVWGFASDSLLAYVPLLKNALPPIEMVQVETQVHQTTETTAKFVQQVPTSAPAPPADGGK